MGLGEAAEAATWMGELTVELLPGELTVTAPEALAVVTLMFSELLKTAPLESHACTTTLWAPGAMAREVLSVLLEIV